ncbi:hypothetical protein LTR78_003382 [Recurvomyces mirabilis]|uniref:GABA permease n=2 Tax=Recurvomyces mirabilis TaxID=574656 RepID=A0AAE1C3N4_9PEZI|nr:hypothetical protein LTR78_003382 [Recurvomyces mirabilis]
MTAMNDTKLPYEHEHELAPRTEAQSQDDVFRSNDVDKINMARMGKTQEMKRVFNQVSLVSFTAIIMGTWQWIIMANSQGLTNGGRAGLFWSYIWTFIGYVLLAASLADMAAMAPTAGGQYHWVSEFAPPKIQKTLSYAAGWLAALSWQAGNASGLYLCATLIQSLIGIRDPSYGFAAWQGWLLTIAMTAFCAVFNIFAEPILPLMQTTFMPVYIATFVATIAIFWALCPHVDAHAALLEITNEGGWSTTGLALMVGQISAIFALGGSDAAAHMSEECRDSGLTVPRAMIWSILINASMGFVAVVSFIFACPSVDDAVNDPSGFPMVYVLNLAGRPSLTIVIVFLNLLILMIGNVAYQASTARQTFAFARDGGMPFSGWISRVNQKYHVPVNAVLLTAAFTIILCVINLGSSDAFNAILSLAAVAQMATYSISISCVLYRRVTAPHLLPKAQWGLGRWGVPVNAAGAIYAWFAFFWAFWPSSTPVAADSMNYAIVMFGAVVILALVFFLVKARKTYAGPVTITRAYLDGKHS